MKCIVGLLASLLVLVLASPAVATQPTGDLYSWNTDPTLTYYAPGVALDISSQYSGNCHSGGDCSEVGLEIMAFGAYSVPNGSVRLRGCWSGTYLTEESFTTCGWLLGTEPYFAFPLDAAQPWEVGSFVCCPESPLKVGSTFSGQLILEWVHGSGNNVTTLDSQTFSATVLDHCLVDDCYGLGPGVLPA